MKPLIKATIVKVLTEFDLTREEMVMIVMICKNKWEGIPNGYWSTNFTKMIRDQHIKRWDKGKYILGDRGTSYLENKGTFDIEKLKLLDVVRPEFKTKFYKKSSENLIKVHNERSSEIWRLKRDIRDLNVIRTQMETEVDQLNRLRKSENEPTDIIIDKRFSSLESRVLELEYKLP